MALLYTYFCFSRLLYLVDNSQLIIMLMIRTMRDHNAKAAFANMGSVIGIKLKVRHKQKKVKTNSEKNNTQVMKDFKFHKIVCF
jgi:hypothetical protein